MLETNLHRVYGELNMEAFLTATMGSLFRRAAMVLIAVSLAPLLSDSQVLPFKPPCRSADTVCAETRDMSVIPALVLWAWERPEDLRFIDPTRTGVAFLAGTVRLGPNGMSYRRRMQPLQIARETRLVAVVRIEAASGAQLDSETARRVAAEIARAGGLPQVVAVQVDFDATASQRPFYREMLMELRQQLPAAMPISITALTSWCIGDRWMAGLPIDEAVPMLFRMGTGQAEVKNWMGSGQDFREAACRTSLGVSLDEPRPQLAGRRLYAFSPSPWTERSLQMLLEGAQSWR